MVVMLKRKSDSRSTAAPNPYLGALKRQKTALLFVLGFSGLVNVLMLTGSIYMLQVYDRVLSSGSVPTLLGLFTIVVVLYLFFGLFDFLRHRLLSRIALRLDMGFGAETFSAWITSALQQGRRQDSDETPPQPMRQLGVLRQFISSPTAVSLFDLPFMPIFLGAMFMIHFWLGMMVLAGAGVAGLIALISHAMTRDRQPRSMAQDTTLQMFGDTSHDNAETIVAMGMQDNVATRWKTMQTASLAAQQQVINPTEVLTTASKTFRLMLQSTILTVGAFLVLQNQISAGMIIASSILSARALAPIDQVIGQWRSIARALNAHRILCDFFKDHAAPDKYVNLPAPTGRLTVSQLTKLKPGQTGKNAAPLLHNVQFDLQPGDGLGIVGKSASGKSTLARLLVGAWKADRGDVRLDGATLSQWDPAILGQSIGYLPQKVTLMPGTIAENIARFAPQAQDKDVIAAAQIAGVHDIILSLPDGYVTPVGGASGTPLSGGQIQRLGLARAVYLMPSLVVLDEPNANLDADGDNALAAAITALREADKTVIVMAHRPSAIAAVNKIMILNEGRVARFGDKDDILGPPKAVPAAADATPQTSEGPISVKTGMKRQNVTSLPMQIAAPKEGHKTNQEPGRAPLASDAASGLEALRVAAQDDTPLESTKLARILAAERARDAQMSNDELRPKAPKSAIMVPADPTYRMSSPSR